MEVKYKELKNCYETDYYLVYPKKGKVISKSTKREIAKDNSKIMIVKGKEEHRSRIKKIRFIYETVNGPLPHGAVIKAIDGNEANARYDNIEVVKDRTKYFEGHKWSSLNRFTQEEVEKIRETYRTQNESYDSMARMFGCSISTIQKIMQHKYVYDK